MGKRKISAIPNEQFNKMSPNDILKDFTGDLRETIPTLERSLKDITPLIGVLIEQYGDFIKEALRAIPQALTNAMDINLNIGGGGSDTLRAELAKLGSTAAIGSRQSTSGLAQLIVDLLVKGERTKEFEEFKEAGGSKASTISGLTVTQARQQAIEKQIAHERELERVRIARANLSVQERQSFVVNPQVQPGIRQRAAGQSQRIERTRLIGCISYNANQMKIHQSTSRAHRVGRANMKDCQQRLVNLLARYRF